MNLAIVKHFWLFFRIKQKLFVHHGRFCVFCPRTAASSFFLLYFPVKDGSISPACIETKNRPAAFCCRTVSQTGGYWAT